MALLRKLGVKGTQKEFETLVEDVKGHALTLNLLGTYLRDAHAGDIRHRDLVKLEEADIEEQAGHAFHVMDAYVRWLEGSESRLQAVGGVEPAKAGIPNPSGQRALALLRLLGLFDRPADAGCLNALLQAPAIPGLTDALVGMSEPQRNLALSRLEAAKLLTVNRDTAGTLLSLDAHPLIREYFATELKKGSAGVSPAVFGVPPKTSAEQGQSAGTPTGSDWDGRAPQTSNAWREGHRRLYEHLCASTKEGDQPTLEDLQPLYQAVAHGCQAGLQQEAHDKVWFDRIRHGNDYYSTKRLGAFGSDLGAVACFFEPPWSRLSPALTEADQAVLLNFVGYALHALGRLTEALEPMRAGKEYQASKEHWKNAAIVGSNLTELELTLGTVGGAVKDAVQSVTYADRSGDAFLRMGLRTTYADALHQAGRRAEAETRFREAEEMQKERQPGYPLLYSLRGFQYCDLLLTEAERAAWRIILGSAGVSPAPIGDPPTGMEGNVPLPSGRPATASASSIASGGPPDATGQWPVLPLIAACGAVEQRAAKMFEWRVPGDSLLDIALDHLTLGRAALYRAILEKSAIRNPQSAIELAVSGLRRAGDTARLPLGLLTRAWLRVLAGDATGARTDLDEAWEIAERGPMKLHLADIHLYRARLFRGQRTEDRGQPTEGGNQKYPWGSPEADLTAASKLINECGYHRRDEELADAKTAMGL